MDEVQARSNVLSAAREYFKVARPEVSFQPGISPVPVSGKVIMMDDLDALIEASLDMWLTTGRFAERFEKALASKFGMRFAKLVNSGSSANLLALSSLTSPQLGERRLIPGDEVITAAAGFPTTVNPILQNGLVPVFVDSVLATYDVDADAVESAIGPKTRAIMLAHTLGNPMPMRRLKQIAAENDLWLIEDCCDALGATYEGQPVGSFGHLATVSFYPAHHITTGEGGAVLCGARLEKIVESFRDWGRDCWCAPGCENTCGKRFEWQLGGLPAGYDHKYIYSHIGYNLKMTDMQAAIGLSQLEKVDGFIERRRKNWARLRTGLDDLQEFLILPEAAPNSNPSWFGFLLTMRSGKSSDRDQLVRHLESSKIATRLLFGGNLTKQPAFTGLNYRVHGELEIADKIMNGTFWIGVFPGISDAALDYVIEVFHDYYKT